jgi:hypothetical protein
MADNTCFYIMMSNWIRKYNQNQNTFLYITVRCQHYNTNLISHNLKFNYLFFSYFSFRIDNREGKALRDKIGPTFY